MKKKKKLIIIGLDGVGPGLIQNLINKDRIPNIKKIINNGTFKSLKSTIPPVTIPAWPCMVSGKDPAEIGLFDIYSRKNYISQPNRNLKFEPFWSKIPNKCGIITVPGTYPAKKINGFLLTGMFTPSIKDKNFIYPDRIKESIREELRKFKISINWNNEQDLIKQLINLTKTRFKISLKLWNKEKPDVLMVVENGTDWIQHFLYKYYDITNPHYINNPELKSKFYSYFQVIDQEIGRLLKEIKDCDFLIVSDHGAQSLKGNFCLNEWLRRNKYLVFKKIKGGLIVNLLKRPKLDFNKINYLLKKFKIKKIIWRIFRGTGLSKKIPSSKGIKWSYAVNKKLIDWSRTKAFCLGNGIYINSENLENGCVKEEESIQIKKELISKLISEKFDEFEQCVKPKEEVYAGKYLDSAPDILFYDKNWEYWPINDINTKRIVLPVEKNTYRNGTHSENGIWISSFKYDKEKIKLQEVHNFIIKKYGVKTQKNIIEKIRI